MKLDKSIAVLAMVASLVLAAGTAAAQTNTPGEADVESQLTLDEYQPETTSTADLDGGNVTNANISAQQSTDQWAGVYGTANGSLVLGAGTQGTDGSLLYEWEADADEVYASNGSVVWSNIINGDASTVDSYFGISGSDSAVNTFTATTQTVTVGPQSVGGDTALTYNSTGDGDWSTIILEDNSSAVGTTNLPVFAGIVGEGSDAFNDDTADYQLLLPAEDGDTGTTTSYNMYLELS